MENSEPGVVIAPGNCDGTFGPSYADATALNNGLFGQITLADVNGDGRLDLIATQRGGSEVESSTTSGISVSPGTAQTVLPASTSVTVDRAAQAQPMLTQASGPGSLTHTGNAYTLNLGTLAQNSAAVDVLALANAAAAPADSFKGAFSAPVGSGFIVTGAELASALAAGRSNAGLTFTADTSMPAAQSETITFEPTNLTDDPAVTAALPADLPVGDETAETLAPADMGGADVALVLSPITLTELDDVVPGGAPSAPTITGTLAGQCDSNEASINPSARILIADVNGGQTKAVTVSPSAAANGTLSDPAAATDGSTLGAGGMFTVSGSASQVTTDLQGPTLMPTPHQVAPGTAVTTQFTVAVTDTAGQTATDATTTVVATAVDDAPVIAGMTAGQSIAPSQTVQPFAAATITDPDFGASLTTTITLSAAEIATNADGTLAGSGLTQPAWACTP